MSAQIAVDSHLTLDEMVRELVTRVWKLENENLVATSERLGVSSRTIERWLASWDEPRERMEPHYRMGKRAKVTKRKAKPYSTRRERARLAKAHAAGGVTFVNWNGF